MIPEQAQALGQGRALGGGGLIVCGRPAGRPLAELLDVAWQRLRGALGVDQEGSSQGQ